MQLWKYAFDRIFINSSPRICSKKKIENKNMWKEQKSSKYYAKIVIKKFYTYT